MTDRTDAELLRESRRRPDAFVDVCERHVGALERWLRNEARDPHVAEELLAETLAEAWRVRRRFRDPGDGSAGPWLFGIARNLLARYRREGAVAARARDRLGLRLEPPVADPYEDVDRRLDGEARRAALSAAVAVLPAEQREALERRVLAGHGAGEVGAALNIAPATVRSRVHRALGALRERLEGANR
jgi:RNA polymerase sigma-70 factor (ECF subfamily)